MKPLDLVSWRKRNGFSQIKLAKILGVSTITVYRWEKSMREIPPFLHLALKWVESKGGEIEVKGKKIRKRKEVKK
jgi:transcriptional regulator with XRE-family HTH domain